jgi:hypothetical protein
MAQYCAIGNMKPNATVVQADCHGNFSTAVFFSPGSEPACKLSGSSGGPKVMRDNALDLVIVLDTGAAVAPEFNNAER